MQLLSVLKGCGAAYIAGVTISWVAELLSQRRGASQVLDQWSTLLAFVIYGAVFALPIGFLVVVCWFFLSRKNYTAKWHLALIVGAGVISLLFWALSGTPDALLTGILLGLVLGAVFWVAAFGPRRSVLMHRD